MKKIRAILINTFCILFLNTCFQPAYGKEQKFKGDYTTESIRTLWFMCQNSIRTREPYAPQMAIALVCDCVTDSLRKELSHQQFLKTDSPTRKEMAFRITSLCMMSLKGEKAV